MLQATKGTAGFSSQGVAPDGGEDDSLTSGPWNWSTRCSAELQKVVDAFCIEGLYEQNFSLTVADPSLPGCPLVACSIGFTELTGYSVEEIVGRNCKFLLDGVPPDLIDNEVRRQCRALGLASASGEEYDGHTDYCPSGFLEPWGRLPKGELICVQTNARKSGELFRNMFHLKQIELNDATFIWGLQVGLPEQPPADASVTDLGRKCKLAFDRLEANMSVIESILCQRFMYAAPMRRQHAD